MKRKLYNVFRFLMFCLALILPLCVSSNSCLAYEKISSDIQSQNITKVNKGNDNFECEVNCCFPIGQTCIPAYHIQRHGKRFQASPLDWMKDYSLDTCSELSLKISLKKYRK